MRRGFDSYSPRMGLVMLPQAAPSDLSGNVRAMVDYGYFIVALYDVFDSILYYMRYCSIDHR